MDPASITVVHTLHCAYIQNPLTIAELFDGWKMFHRLIRPPHHSRNQSQTIQSVVKIFRNMEFIFRLYSTGFPHACYRWNDQPTEETWTNTTLSQLYSYTNGCGAWSDGTANTHFFFISVVVCGSAWIESPVWIGLQTNSFQQIANG